MAQENFIACMRKMRAARHAPTRILIFVIAAITGITTTVAVAGAIGETYVYRLINGYNNEVQGQVSYRIDTIDANRVVMSVIPGAPSAGMARTEIYTADGNWLRHPLVNHDKHVDYEFSTAYPAYVFPLDKGKTWSQRVEAINPVTQRRVSVRVDAEVLGAERVRVPAGEFDTIKVRRTVYAGDWDGLRDETRVSEIDWFAPALGRSVRSDSSSIALDRSQSDRYAGGQRGDQPIYELVSISKSSR